MSSVRRIAAKVGVSVATVSRALNNHPHVDPDTRRRVLEAANQSGYRPGGVQRQPAVIGLVYPGELMLVGYGEFEQALMAGIMRGSNEQKFDVKLVSMQRDKSADETYTQFFVRKGLRGVILRSVESSRHICEEIAKEGFPSVVVADRFENPAVNFICCDSRSDSQRAVQHLFDMGHRRIGLAVHAVRDTDHEDRKAGYEDALRENGLGIDPHLVVEIMAWVDGGASVINRLMSLPQPPTAIYFTDPMVCFGALRRCMELGIKVPSELSIVGFDDTDTRRHAYPAFTAVVQDAVMLGFESSRWLTRMLSGVAPKTMRQVRQTSFEINQTTAPPPLTPIRVLPDGTRLPVKVDGRGDVGPGVHGAAGAVLAAVSANSIA